MTEIIEPGLTRYFNKAGKLHRKSGPAVIWEGGGYEWYKSGKKHREDGPAVEWADGSKAWFQNDRPHRVDGPAFEYADGRRLWFWEGEEMTEAQFKSIVDCKRKDLAWQEAYERLHNLVDEQIARNFPADLEPEIEALGAEVDRLQLDALAARAAARHIKNISIHSYNQQAAAA
jgi:hypothetical protein